MANSIASSFRAASRRVFEHTGCRSLHTQVWRTSGEFPKSRLASMKDKTESLGVAFSGGGTRSASATLGQMAALDRLECRAKQGSFSELSRYIKGKILT